MDATPHCYRHPGRETLVSCSECGRPICEECMTFAPVGIRCPDHANIGAPKGQAKRAVRKVKFGVTRSAAPVTGALIAINVLVYLVNVAQGGSIGNTSGGSVYERGTLVGVHSYQGEIVGLSQGEWWRLATAMFLHASIIHLALNMFALYFIGTIVENSIGSARFAAIYFVSGLAGSTGALLAQDPTTPTVGASGAIYGILGSLLILEYLATGSFAGQAMTMIVLNLALSFTFPGISIGGHIGGLIGGIAASAALVFARRFRSKPLTYAAIVAVGVIAVAIAVAKVESYPTYRLGAAAVSTSGL